MNPADQLIMRVLAQRIADLEQTVQRLQVELARTQAVAEAAQKRLVEAEKNGA